MKIYKICLHFTVFQQLGSVMCGFLPFITTAAILASSMTLVGIAVDRYFAVMKAVISFWNPDAVLCVISVCGIWAAAFGIASPVFIIYVLIPVYILKAGDDEDAFGKIDVDNVVSANAQGATSNSIDSVSSNDISAWQSNDSKNDLSYTLVREQELVRMCLSNQVSL